MGWVGLIGAGISALSQYQANKDNNDAVRAAAREDLAAGNEQAAYVQASAMSDAARIRRLKRLAEGEATAAQAASGVEVSSGSPSAVQRDIDYRGELDAYTALFDADVQASMLKRRGLSAMTNANAQIGANTRAANLQMASMLAEGLYTYGSRWKRSPKATGGVGT